MSDKPENPQAYPCLDSSGYGLSMRDPGMTLRDYFAGQAIVMCLKDMNKPYWGWAREAYEIADAMLAERVK